MVCALASCEEVTELVEELNGRSESRRGREFPCWWRRTSSWERCVSGMMMGGVEPQWRQIAFIHELQKDLTEC